jgi:hypothetical protein
MFATNFGQYGVFAAKAGTSTRVGSASGPPTPDSLQHDTVGQRKRAALEPVYAAPIITSTRLGSASQKPSSSKEDLCMLGRPSRQPSWAAHRGHPHQTACKSVSGCTAARVSTMYVMQGHHVNQVGQRFGHQHPTACSHVVCTFSLDDRLWSAPLSPPAAAASMHV